MMRKEKLMEIAQNNKYYFAAVVSYRGKSNQVKNKELIVLSHRHCGCFEKEEYCGGTSISFLFLSKNNAMNFYKEAYSKKLINKKYLLYIDRLKWVTDAEINGKFVDYATY